MFQLVTDSRTQKSARVMLRGHFSLGARRATRTFKSPGGGYKNAETFIRDDLGIWAVIESEPGGALLLGVGEPGWQIGLIMSVPKGRTLHSGGQLVRNDQGRLFLAHQGGLGGGKFSVSRAAFASQIEGFAQEAVLDGRSNREMFVIADVRRLSDLQRLALYVKEAQRIRDIRRSSSVAVSQMRGFSEEEADSADSRENDEGGAYDQVTRVEFERRHGLVQNALSDTLRKAGYQPRKRRLGNGLKADLVMRANGAGRGFLFEIKVSMSAQAHFTAIGQLLVYGSGHSEDLCKVLVSPRLPASELFSKTLAKLQITVLEYEITSKNRVKFGSSLWKLLKAR